MWREKGEIGRGEAPWISKYIEYTLLEFGMGENDVERICLEARKYGFFGVCIPPRFVRFAKDVLSETDVIVVSVVGFPLGSNTTKIKVLEASECIDMGADEIDMVIDIGGFIEGKRKEVGEEIAEVVGVISPHPLKVIIEVPLLNYEQKKEACSIASDYGARFVKTSTGFHGIPTKPNDVRLLCDMLPNSVGVKASGGIRGYYSALEMLGAGASRIGTSSGVVIAEEAWYHIDRPSDS
ncbi:MAG: deoxyribose-phosphate aldolase [bacterium]